mgnify:CR=1 FL=1
MQTATAFIQHINVTIKTDNLDVLKEIRAHAPDIEIMFKSGVFNFKGGKAVLHRDHEGRLRRIDIEDNKFRS